MEAPRLALDHATKSGHGTNMTFCRATNRLTDDAAHSIAQEQLKCACNRSL